MAITRPPGNSGGERPFPLGHKSARVIADRSVREGSDRGRSQVDQYVLSSTGLPSTAFNVKRVGTMIPGTLENCHFRDRKCPSGDNANFTIRNDRFALILQFDLLAIDNCP